MHENDENIKIHKKNPSTYLNFRNTIITTRKYVTAHTQLLLKLSKYCHLYLYNDMTDDELTKKQVSQLKNIEQGT